MATSNRAVDIDASEAVRLDSSSDKADGVAGQGFTAYNVGPDEVRFGDEDVTGAAAGPKLGLPVLAGQWFPAMALGTGDHVYAICAVGDVATVLVFETGV